VPLIGGITATVAGFDTAMLAAILLTAASSITAWTFMRKPISAASC
jgi:hypothetical protein